MDRIECHPIDTPVNSMGPRVNSRCVRLFRQNWTNKMGVINPLNFVQFSTSSMWNGRAFWLALLVMVSLAHTHSWLPRRLSSRETPERLLSALPSPLRTPRTRLLWCVLFFWPVQFYALFLSSNSPPTMQYRSKSPEFNTVPPSSSSTRTTRWETRSDTC